MRVDDLSPEQKRFAELVYGYSFGQCRYCFPQYPNGAKNGCMFLASGSSTWDKRAVCNAILYDHLLMLRSLRVFVLDTSCVFGPRKTEEYGNGSVKVTDYCRRGFNPDIVYVQSVHEFIGYRRNPYHMPEAVSSAIMKEGGPSPGYPCFRIFEHRPNGRDWVWREWIDGAEISEDVHPGMYPGIHSGVYSGVHLDGARIYIKRNQDGNITRVAFCPGADPWPVQEVAPPIEDAGVA